MQFIKPSKDMTWHLKHLYIKALINGRLIDQAFVNGGAILNVMPIVTLKKLGNSKLDLISINMKITNFIDNMMISMRVLMSNIIMEPKTLTTTFFVLDAKLTYSMLLRRH